MKTNLKALLMSVSLASTFVIVSCGDGTETVESSDLSALSTDKCDPSIDWDFKLRSGVNQRIYRFAKDRVGQRFGDGECATLVAAAARSAGATPHSSLGPTGADANYVWGTYITSARAHRNLGLNAQMGDIVQFKKYAASWKPTPNSTASLSAYHHSAIVVGVSKDRKSLCVLQQNAPIGSGVGYGYVRLSGITSGSVALYRPIKG